MSPLRTVTVKKGQCMNVKEVRRQMIEDGKKREVYEDKRDNA